MALTHEGWGGIALDPRIGEYVYMSPAKTNAERQREFRQRKADTEATEVRGIFAHPDDHAEVKEAAAKIARRRAKKRPT